MQLLTFKVEYRAKADLKSLLPALMLCSEKLDMLRNVDKQEHLIMNFYAIWCITQHPGAEGRLQAPFATALLSSFHLCFMFGFMFFLTGCSVI